MRYGYPFVTVLLAVGASVAGGFAGAEQEI